MRHDRLIYAGLALALVTSLTACGGGAGSGLFGGGAAQPTAAATAASAQPAVLSDNVQFKDTPGIVTATNTSRVRDLFASGDDPNTKAIAIYMESVVVARSFLSAA